MKNINSSPYELMNTSKFTDEGVENINENQVIITCNCFTPWEFCRNYIASYDKQNHPSERAPEPSTRATRQKKATAREITPRRLRRYGKRKPPEESPQAANVTNTLRILRKLMRIT